MLMLASFWRNCIIIAMVGKRNALGPLGLTRIQEGLESLHRDRSEGLNSQDVSQIGWPPTERRFALFLGPLTEVNVGWPVDEPQQPIQFEENKVIDLRDPADFVDVLPRLPVELPLG